MERQTRSDSEHIIARKPKVVLEHLHGYAKSLNQYLDRYAHLFFERSDAIEIPEYPSYLCPLCVNTGIVLFQDGFVDNGADFTLDHFPPKNVGGNMTILVCRKCNSEAGLFENELKRKLQDRSFDKGVPRSERKIRSTISTVKGSYPGVLTMGPNEKINIAFKENEKIHAPLLDKWISRPLTTPNWTAEIKYFVADETKVTKSLLKTAYLFCFQYWGYSFCFSKTGELIRQVLSGKIEYPIKNHGFWLTEKWAEISIPLALCTISLPRNIKSFCVNVQLIDLNTKHKEVISILVPGPYQENWDSMKEIEQLIADNPNFNITLRHVQNFSVFDGQMHGYTDSWHAFVSE